MYADVKIRKEHADMLRLLALRLNAKLVDVLGLWPRCPRCGSPLVQEGEGVVVCPNCRREYVLTERL